MLVVFGKPGKFPEIVVKNARTTASVHLDAKSQTTEVAAVCRLISVINGLLGGMRPRLG
jgi:hypothetical protein